MNVRCLRLRDSRPEQWRLVSALMDHDQERRAETERYISPYTRVIRALVTELGAATEQEVITMLGYFDVNSIAVRGETRVWKDEEYFYLSEGDLFGKDFTKADILLIKLVLPAKIRLSEPFIIFPINFYI